MDFFIFSHLQSPLLPHRTDRPVFHELGEEQGMPEVASSTGDSLSGYTNTYTLLTAPGGIFGSAPATLSLSAGWAATVSISVDSLLLNVASVGPLDHFAISTIASTHTVGTPITGILSNTADDGDFIQVTADLPATETTLYSRLLVTE